MAHRSCLRYGASFFLVCKADTLITRVCPRRAWSEAVFRMPSRAANDGWGPGAGLGRAAVAALAAQRRDCKVLCSTKSLNPWAPTRRGTTGPTIPAATSGRKRLWPA